MSERILTSEAKPKFTYTYGIELSIERSVREHPDENDQRILAAHLDHEAWKFYDLYITPDGEEYLIEV